MIFTCYLKDEPEVKTEIESLYPTDAAVEFITDHREYQPAEDDTDVEVIVVDNIGRWWTITVGVSYQPIYESKCCHLGAG